MIHEEVKKLSLAVVLLLMFLQYPLFLLQIPFSYLTVFYRQLRLSAVYFTTQKLLNYYT